MNTSEQSLPSVEIVQVGPQQIPSPIKSRRRGGIFLLVLLVCSITSLSYVFVRDPVYRASASVLTVKPKAADTLSQEADAEHVAIQSRLLQGAELLATVADEINNSYGSNFSVAELRQTLSTAPVENTNLLELRAEGNEPALLQDLVNTWAESYESYRLGEVDKLTNNTTAELLDSQAELAAEIAQAREELRTYRETHNIVSSEREENRSLSAIRGLNNSINAAREKEIDAISRLKAIDESIARGDDVVPREQKSEISKMKLDIAHLRDKLESLRERFTEAYIQRDPQLAELPEVLHELEQDLARALRIGAESVRNDAAQDVQAARRSVSSLEQQLAEKETQVQAFTQYFKQYKLLEEELSRLESLFADNEERIAKLRIVDNEKYPPLKIIETATLPDAAIYPNYQRDAFIAVIFSLAFALFVTWLIEFLSARPSPTQAAGNIGIRVHPYPSDPSDPSDPNHLPQSSANSTPALSTPQPQLIDGTGGATSSPALPPHVNIPTISNVMSRAGADTAGHLSLLLSGVTPIELQSLNSRCFSDENCVIIVSGENARKLSIDPKVWHNFDFIRQSIDQPLSVPLLEKLDIDLVNLARDAHIPNPAEISALTIWHSYVVYLIEQGINDELLFQTVGRIPDDVLTQLRRFLPLEAAPQIELTHPSLFG